MQKHSYGNRQENSVQILKNKNKKQKTSSEKMVCANTPKQIKIIDSTIENTKLAVPV